VAIAAIVTGRTGGDEAIDPIADIGSMNVWLSRIADEIIGIIAAKIIRKC
jgi:hypothetical protein